MKTVSVLVAGGGPVGLTLPRDLARRGIDCLLVERNATTTRHPKMDNTNVRSMGSSANPGSRTGCARWPSPRITRSTSRG